MAGDDLVLDLVVCSLGKNAAGDELVLGGIGAAVDDALGVGVADAGEGLELIGGGGADVLRRRRSRCCRRGLGWPGWSKDEGEGKKEGGGQQISAKSYD